MNIDLEKIILTGIKQILSNTENKTPEPQEKSQSQYDAFIGKYVIVRHRMMGVNFGKVVAFDDNNITLTESRKLWKWNIKDVGVCLEDVAISGLNPDTSKSKVSSTVTLVIIPNNQNLSCLIEVSEQAKNSIINAPIAHQN